MWDWLFVSVRLCVCICLFVSLRVCMSVCVCGRVCGTRPPPLKKKKWQTCTPVNIFIHPFQMSSFSVYDDAVNNNEDNNAARQNYAYYFPNFWIKFICVEKFHDFFRLFCDPNFFFSFRSYTWNTKQSCVFGFWSHIISKLENWVCESNIQGKE